MAARHRSLLLSLPLRPSLVSSTRVPSRLPALADSQGDRMTRCGSAIESRSFTNRTVGGWVMARHVYFVCVLLLAPVAALAQGGGWEVEVHGGGAIASTLSGGTTNFPAAAPLATLNPQFPSRRVSTRFGVGQPVGGAEGRRRLRVPRESRNHRPFLSGIQFRLQRDAVEGAKRCHVRDSSDCCELPVGV